jgi:type I restriction enzyme S subunit
MMELIELGNECEIITKGTTPTTLGKSFTTIGVGFLRAQNVINSNVLIDEDILYIDDETHNNELKRSQIFDGDVLLTIAGTIGRTAIVKNINIQLNCNQAVAIIRLGDSKINKEYLCHFIASPNAQEQFFKGMVTATIANLSLAQIRKLKIPLPPLPQQQKIANILDAADALRQNDKALIAKYDELTQTLFLDMFGDPVSNPKGWEKVELKYFIYKLNTGVSVNSEDGSYEGGKYFILKTSCVYSGIFDPKQVKTIREDEIQRAKLNPKKDSIIISRMNTSELVGKSAYIFSDFPSIYLPDRLWQTEKTNLEHSVLWLSYNIGHKSFMNEISKISSGTSGSMKNISKSSFLELKSINPPLELQNQFAERVAVIEEQKAIAQKSLEKSESLFNSLLQRAFKGELV